MSQFTQDNRFIAVSDFSLGKDTFLLTDFDGHEYISGLFEFQLTVLSENLDVDPNDIVGKSCAVEIKDEKGRFFHGYINSFSYGEIAAQDSGVTFREYRLRMVPWLWFLSQTNDHRIYQEKNTKEIVEHIFQEHGFSDFEFNIDGGKVREYCVQHNESDFHFVSRLLEEEGIAYFFKHEKSKHILVLVDQKNAYDELPETKLEYSKGTTSDTQIFSWEHIYKFKKGQWTLNDYDFKTPARDLKANIASKSKFAKNKEYEHYEYPGLYESSLGSNLVKVRLDAEETSRDTVQAKSNCATFYAGGRFALAKHNAASEKGEYTILSIHHHAQDRSYYLSDQSASYSNQFVCVPSDIHIRPSLVHQKPVMRGPQSALVVGPSGEEIYIDEYGRIKVQFIWDREGKKDENSSCFIRVMQSWAGNQWGASFIPRIGHEVIVDFLDGDPDRPIVSGTVYNGKNKPPFESKTQSGIRTRSTLDGTASNCNELRFDDKKGSEQVFIHAEKNLDSEVENDETHSVDHDRTKTIGNDENSSIGNNRDKSVGNDESESIGNNKTISVGKNHSESIGGNKSLTVSGDHSESISKSMTISVSKDLKETVSGAYQETVTKEYGLKAKEILMTADKQITLKTGSAKIVMKSNGDITISGKNINIKGSGNVVLKGSKVTAN
ncbi:type VI secretion system secreted protein VgrG [Alteromonadaceae bacterium Bs31]|nr:type VI secretion system secreted protein VgrG [Alteromonadaceae bacterium Bs31]